MKLGKRKKKTPKGYDVSAGGNIDYNRPHDKTDFSVTSYSRKKAEDKLYSKLAEAGAVSPKPLHGSRGAEYNEKGYKKKISYVDPEQKRTRHSIKVQSPANLEGGGKMRGYKFMEEGGETDPPKKYSFVQQAYIDNTLPTDEASLRELIETASIEKRQTAKMGDATGVLMWTASEEGKEYDGLTGISEKGSASAANYYDTLIAKAEEKLMSIKGSKPDLMKEGEFGENLGKELEKGRSLDDVNETLKGERGYKF